MSRTFEELDPNKFKVTAENRQKKIDAAAFGPLPKTFPVNELARRLHPERQYMKIEKITEPGPDARCFRLVPNKENGTEECALFQAGQYLNVFLNIRGMKVNRAYSISSSPMDAKKGFYELTVKSVNDGLVSCYMLDNWKEGDEVEVSAPYGFFTYSPLRDAATVVGIAGGSGITPFLSMARAIAEGDEDFNLFLLYGSRSEEAILYREEFARLEKASDKIKIVHVLSDEKKDGYEEGFINAELIRRYAPEGAPYSVFLCGPQAMYGFVDKELAAMGLERKYIRHELFGEIHNPADRSDYPGCPKNTVQITVSVRDVTRTVTGDANDSVMQILEKNGIAVPSRCRSGECGFCHSLLKSGEVYIPKDVDGRRLADFKFGYIHPCVAFPLSDLELEVPPAK